MEKKAAEVEEEITLEEYLIYSARCGDLDGIMTCIKEKTDINTKDAYKNTALRIFTNNHISDMASANGHEKAVKLLLDNGARLDEQNEAKNTPLRICFPAP